MATKTITIDVEAYERLRKAKKEGESFSQTIKRLIKPRLDYDAWLQRIRKNPLSLKAVEAIEEQVRSRRRSSGRIR